jgi:hypothetical protein
VRLQVLMASSIKMIVLCNIAPCSLVDNDRRFRGTYYLHHPDDEISVSEPSVNFYDTTKRSISEYGHLQIMICPQNSQTSDEFTQRRHTNCRLFYEQRREGALCGGCVAYAQGTVSTATQRGGRRTHCICKRKYSKWKKS